MPHTTDYTLHTTDCLLHNQNKVRPHWRRAIVRLSILLPNFSPQTPQTSSQTLQTLEDCSLKLHTGGLLARLGGSAPKTRSTFAQQSLAEQHCLAKQHTGQQAGRLASPQSHSLALPSQPDILTLRLTGALSAPVKPISLLCFALSSGQRCSLSPLDGNLWRACAAEPGQQGGVWPSGPLLRRRPPHPAAQLATCAPEPKRQLRQASQSPARHTVSARRKPRRSRRRGPRVCCRQASGKTCLLLERQQVFPTARWKGSKTARLATETDSERNANLPPVRLWLSFRACSALSCQLWAGSLAQLIIWFVPCCCCLACQFAVVVVFLLAP